MGIGQDFVATFVGGESTAEERSRKLAQRERARARAAAEGLEPFLPTLEGVSPQGTKTRQEFARREQQWKEHLGRLEEARAHARNAARQKYDQLRDANPGVSEEELVRMFEATPESRQFERTQELLASNKKGFEETFLPSKEKALAGAQGLDAKRALHQDIDISGEGRDAQRQVLNRLAGLTDTGITNAERAAMDQLVFERGLENRAQQGAISQQMESRGMATGGGLLAQQALAQQGTANRLAGDTRSLQQQAQQRAMNALIAKGNLGANMQSAEQSLKEFNERNRSGAIRDEFNARMGQAQLASGTAAQGANFYVGQQDRARDVTKDRYDKIKNIATGVAGAF